VAGARLAEYWGATGFNLIDLPEQIKCHVIGNSLRHDKLAATLVLCQIYLAIEQACLQKGLSPDAPRNLSKVTLT